MGGNGARLTDDLVNLVLEIIHRLQTRSRRTVVNGFAHDMKGGSREGCLLFDIAEAAIDGTAKISGVTRHDNADGLIDRGILCSTKADQCQDLSAARPRRFWGSPGFA